MASSLKKSFLFFTNLNFPHLAYEPFSLDNFDSSEAKAEFRVDKEDIPLFRLTLYRSQKVFDALKEQVKLSATSLVSFRYFFITEIILMH